MAIVRFSYRGFKFFRNVALIFAGALIIVLTLAFPRLFGNQSYGISGVAQADAPGGGGSSSGDGCGDASSGSCSGGGDGDGDGCAGDGGDCSY